MIERYNMKHIVMGILAHVDAGKTTLSESVLFASNTIRKSGRVDHGDAFLDYDSQERNRGITIFSKQAEFSWNTTTFTLVDTPGHSDFSSEMERTLSILDYAILVISALDGIQLHTKTIWKLLAHYQIPTFIFVNKMDVDYVDKDALLHELETELDDHCVDAFNMEMMAMTSDELLEEYSETNTLQDTSIQNAIYTRQLFPCFFGSALKQEGITNLLDALDHYTKPIVYPDIFGARIFKVTHDENNQRLVHMKITGGNLLVKTRIEEDKVDEIRSYQGNRFTRVDCASAGRIYAIKGMDHYYAGDVLGNEKRQSEPVLSSYLHYDVLLPMGYDVMKAWQIFRSLKEEDPQLSISFDASKQLISIQFMGEVQISVLKQLLLDRYDLAVDFKQGRVVFKETIAEAVEGVGHFEPLRHYAEVHLLLEPLPVGSGLVFSNICSQEDLALNWQNLVITHLKEKEHLGVLTRSPITDMRITLLTGKAHQKHTEGGDFRQATYRAIRQGLKHTQSILLEPYYAFRLELPNEFMSRAIYDIENQKGTYEIASQNEEKIVLVGNAPIRKMQHYQNEVQHYTKGKGKLYCVMDAYRPCVDAETIISELAYDSESDLENPTGSIFCTRGAGFYVPWNEVYQHMHIKSTWFKTKQKQQYKEDHYTFSEKEVLSMLFPKNQGTKRKQYASKQQEKQYASLKASLPKCMLVDGYNVIYAWESLASLAKENLDAARHQLIDVLCSYQGYRNMELILVFDAYQVKDQIGTMQKHGNIHVIYTKSAQSADTYIEKATHKMAKDFEITVVSSDALIQLITMGQGAMRKSALELEKEIAYYHDKAEINQAQKQQGGYVKPLSKITEYKES